MGSRGSRPRGPARPRSSAPDRAPRPPRTPRCVRPGAGRGRRAPAVPRYDHVCSVAMMAGVRASRPTTLAQTFEPNVCACRMSVGRARRWRTSPAHGRTFRTDVRSSSMTRSPVSASAARMSGSSGRRPTQISTSKRARSTRFAISVATSSAPPRASCGIRTVTAIRCDMPLTPSARASAATGSGSTRPPPRGCRRRSRLPGSRRRARSPRRAR